MELPTVRGIGGGGGGDFCFFPNLMMVPLAKGETFPGGMCKHSVLEYVCARAYACVCVFAWGFFFFYPFCGSHKACSSNHYFCSTLYHTLCMI